MPTYKHKKRAYLHFDSPPTSDSAKALVEAPSKVARHAFYPFLGFTITTPKVQKGTQGEFIRKDKKRPIKLAAHLDAAIYAHYGSILSEFYEAEVKKRGLGRCVIAFRRAGPRGRNNISFADEVFEFIRSNRPCMAICLDIEKFFDRLDHAILKARWGSTLGVDRLTPDHFNVFRSLSNFSWVDRDAAFRAVGISPNNPKPKGLNRSRICNPDIFRKKIRGSRLIWSNPEHNRQRGIPQGAPMSALLSNLYMLEFDTTMEAAVSACGGLYRRYCDDIMVVVPATASESIEALAITEISKLKLSINNEKTTRAMFPQEANLPAQDGKRIQYLGFDYDGLRKLIRASSLGRYYGKMRRGVRLALLTQKRHNKWLREKGMAETDLKTRQLYIRYSYLIGRRFHRKNSGHDRQDQNFLTYAYKAAEIMKAPEIKHQVRRHFPKLKAEIAKALK